MVAVARMGDDAGMDRNGTAAVALAVGLALCGCGDDGGADGGGGSGSSGATVTTTGPSSGAGSSACERGLVECDGACVDVLDDEAHCGACGAACGADQICHARECTSPVDLCVGDAWQDCATTCTNTFDSIDHCGGCDVACDATAWCQNGSCTPRVGDGTSCASPFVIVDDETMQFWFADGQPHLFTCGPLEARPSVYFRWTATDTDGGNVKVKLQGADTDDLVIEVFSAATCDGGVSIGCNDTSAGGDPLAEAEFPATTGQTYFVVVGSATATPPEGRFAVRMDD